MATWLRCYVRKRVDKSLTSQVDENMQKAQERDAARRNKFYFRRHVFPPDRPSRSYDLASRPVSPPGTDRSSRPTPHGSSSNLRSHVHADADGSQPNGHGHTPAASGSASASASWIFDPHAAHHPRDGSNGSNCSSPVEEDPEEVEALTLDEAINGRPDGFPGLMGVVNAYLNSLNVDVSTKCDLRRYLDLIKHRAQGECGVTGSEAVAEPETEIHRRP